MNEGFYVTVHQLSTFFAKSRTDKVKSKAAIEQLEEAIDETLQLRFDWRYIFGIVV